MVRADAKSDMFYTQYTALAVFCTCLLETKIRYRQNILGHEIGKDNKLIDLS